MTDGDQLTGENYNYVALSLMEQAVAMLSRGFSEQFGPTCFVFHKKIMRGFGQNKGNQISLNTYFLREGFEERGLGFPAQDMRKTKRQSEVISLGLAVHYQLMLDSGEIQTYVSLSSGDMDGRYVQVMKKVEDGSLKAVEPDRPAIADVDGSKVCSAPELAGFFGTFWDIYLS